MRLFTMAVAVGGRTLLFTPPEMRVMAVVVRSMAAVEGEARRSRWINGEKSQAFENKRRGRKGMAGSRLEKKFMAGWSLGG